MSNHDSRFMNPKKGNEFLLDEKGEPFSNLSKFWRWSYSNIMYNTIRGDLAEFFVYKAIEDKLSSTHYSMRRDGDVCDFQFDDILVEVKSAAYVQAWEQKKESRILFDIAKRGDYDFETKKPNNKKKKRWANVYVFALLKEKNRDIVDPTKLSQWEFWVASTTEIDRVRADKKHLTYKQLKSVNAIQSSFEKLSSDIESVHRKWTQPPKSE